MTEPCCERDHNGDGNCDRHPEPGSPADLRIRAIQESRAERNPRKPGSQELRTRADFAAAGETFAKWPRNPIPAHRSIAGRACRTFLNGAWMASALTTQYAIEADGSGGGRLVVDKVNSALAKMLRGTEAERSGHTLEVVIADAATPGQERTVLRDVRFKSYVGGYIAEDIVQEEVFFTFAASELAEAIEEPLQLDVWEAPGVPEAVAV